MAIKGRCYCGATQFEIDALPQSVTACTCTFCSRTGALWAYYKPGEVRFTHLDGDTLYAPRVTCHHFCSVCGMTTFGESPSWDLATKMPDFSNMTIGLNARLFDDVDLSAIEQKTIDGRNLW